jgi:thiol-disulfide isomerase/thioredoxin
VVAITAEQVRTLAARPGARATLVNVWATWCVPCRQEFPALLRVARARARAGLRLVLVSADFPEQLPAVRRFLAARGVRDTTYVKTGDDMAFIDSLSRTWSGALPATFVYDRNGRLAEFWEGEADTGRFRRAVDQVLAGSHPMEASRR